MIILIAGATHTGKTVLAQRLLEEYKYPYISIDHLKMGLIRSKQTELTAEDDAELTPYLWRIVKEIIKTAIENNQNLIAEGCYIPFDWQNDFTDCYLSQIKYICLVMSKSYIENKFSDIAEFENAVERRLRAGDIDKDELIRENGENLKLCKKFSLPYIVIDKSYAPEKIMNFLKNLLNA